MLMLLKLQNMYGRTVLVLMQLHKHYSGIVILLLLLLQLLQLQNMYSIHVTLVPLLPLQLQGTHN